MKFTFKNIEMELVKRNEMLVKNIEERTTIKNTISNGITRLKKVSEMDTDIVNFTEVEKLFEELKADVKKADAVLNVCSSKFEPKPTYYLKEYKSPSIFLYDLAIRIHKVEDIYAYEIVQNSKPKYGKIVLATDRINIHALTLTKVDKVSSLISFEDLRKCISDGKKEKFRPFMKLGE